MITYNADGVKMPNIRKRTVSALVRSVQNAFTAGG